MGHRTLQSGLREWVEEQTEHPVGYLEQLYTFADRDRNNDDPGRRTISISYLGLVNEQSGAGRPGWHGWYEYFPWEDHRQGAPAVLDEIMARLRSWADADPARRAPSPPARGISPSALMAAAGTRIWPCSATNCFTKRRLVSEASDAGRRPISGRRDVCRSPPYSRNRNCPAARQDQIPPRRLRADAGELHAAAGCSAPSKRLAGLTLHKQNFRRLIEQQELVEETGGTESETGGRPAKLFRFRHTVLEERALAGTKLPLSRT